MALKLYARCEGATLDGTHDFTAGDSTWSAVNSPSFTSTGGLVGGNGMQFDAAGEYYYLDPTSIFDPADFAVGFWVRVDTSHIGTGSTVGFRILNDGTTSNTIHVISADGAGGLSLRISSSGGGAVVLAASGTAITLGARHFVLIEGKSSTNYRRIRVYDTSGTLLASATDSSTSWSANVPTGLDRLGIGLVNGGAATEYVDNVFVGTSDDAASILANKEITSYTGWTATSAPTITDAADESFYNGETGVVITGTGFGASQGSGKVYISPTNAVGDGSRVEQTVTAWSDTSITVTAVKGGLSYETNAYLFVVNNASLSNASGRVVQIEARPYVRDTLVNETGATVNSETGMRMVVWHALPSTASPNPAQVIENVSTNGSGQLNQLISRGALALNAPVWMALMKDGSPAKGTLRKVTPVYE